MKLAPIIGLFCSVIIMVWGIMDSGAAKVFLNFHAAVIVIGGTLAATLIAYPFRSVFGMLTVFARRVLSGGNLQAHGIIAEIVSLGDGYRKSESYLQDNVAKIANPFLKEGIQLIVQGGIADAKIDKILLKRAQTHYERYQQEAGMFKVLSKLPPAFGLLGAVLGMVALMQALGGEDAFATIGPAMASAMVATFYGIAFANFILIPIGENLSRSSNQDLLIRTMILEGIKLIRAKEHPIVIEEELKSFLLPSERTIMDKKVA